MTRVGDLPLDALSDEQRAVYAEVASSRGGAARGPFSVWLRTPGVALAASRFGDAVRLHATLPRDLLELVTLVVAAHWRADYPWVAHAQAATRAGISAAVVEAVRTGTSPAFDRAEQQVVHDVGVEVLRSGTLGDASYASALETLGLDQLTEVVTAYGWYTVAAYVTNVFDVAVPDGQRPFSTNGREAGS